jgi:hypothetical protein
MSQTQCFYEANPLYGGLTWLFVKEQIGQDLREWYQVPKELPPKMAALVRKLDALENERLGARTLLGTLDAIEGNQLLRFQREQMVEARIIAGVKAFPDWFVLT